MSSKDNKIGMIPDEMAGADPVMTGRMDKRPMDQIPEKEITMHQVGKLNSALEIMAYKEQCYDRVVLAGRDGKELKMCRYSIRNTETYECTNLKFQNGPVNVMGVNGISVEALLAVVIDRMKGYQNSSFACNENQQALNATEAALAFLMSRTVDRIFRQVEGKNEK